jgi:nicotinate-nucleotide pyrophosphorylase (carboxylating)
MQTNRTNSDLPSREDLINIVRTTLEEDVGSGDITAALIPVGRAATAKIIGREPGILCGTHYAEEVFSQIGLTSGSVAIDWLVGDGDEVKDGTVIASLSGSARSILTGERSALNILQTLSATATTSRHYARLVQHTKVKILDTRKTLPALRTAQKYAVRVGGCDNHRIGLFDAFLIKENHIAACGGIAAAIQRARTLNSALPVEIEVQTMAELDEAITARADIVMLDNFDLTQTIAAVKHTAGRVKLEASGSIDEARLVEIAETGVDFISIGALTKHCRALDLSLLFDFSKT